MAQDSTITSIAHYTDRCLYLDDQRTPTEDRFDVVRNYDEFINYILLNGIPKYISFDHDLHKEHLDDFHKQTLAYGFQYPAYKLYREKTGLDCASWLCKYVEENNLQLRYCGVHSMNPVGGQNIQKCINEFMVHMGWEPNCFMAAPKFTTPDET